MVSHSRNPPKIEILKIPWNRLITLINMKHMQTCWNLPGKKSWNHIKWTYFWLNSKSPPKNWLKKKSWNWRIMLLPATILNMKGMQKPEMEIKWICWNLFGEKIVKSHHVNLFLAGFSYFEHVSRRAATQSWRSAHQTRKGDGLSTPEAITRVSIYLTPSFLYETKQGKTWQETGSHKKLNFP